MWHFRGLKQNTVKTLLSSFSHLIEIFECIEYFQLPFSEKSMSRNSP